MVLTRCGTALVPWISRRAPWAGLLVAALACAAPAHAVPNRVLVLDGDGDGDYVELPSEPYAHLTQATVEGWFEWSAWRYSSQPWGYGTPADGIMLNQDGSSPTVKLFAYHGGGLHTHHPGHRGAAPRRMDAPGGRHRPRGACSCTSTMS